MRINFEPIENHPEGPEAGVSLSLHGALRNDNEDASLSVQGEAL